jgi:hypothetical protein
MGYNYNEYKSALFNDEGQRIFLKVRDKAFDLINKAGVFKKEKILGFGDDWLCLASVDRMVELGELRELCDDCVQHDRVFTRR